METLATTSQHPPATPERLINLDEVERITGFRSSYIYSKIQKSEFPKPVKIGAASRWKFSEIQQWVHHQIQSSPSGKRSGVRA